MGIISFDQSINDQIQQQNELFDRLKKESPAQRFKYPTAPSNADQLSKLLPCSWRGNGFPITNVTTDISRDLVQHKYPNRDGARVEDMGRNPLVIKATCVFVNTIDKAGSETWTVGDLYPTAYQQFLLDMFDGTTGDFVHPFFGKLRCKPMSMTGVIDAAYRGGEAVNATWIETIDDDSIDNTLQSLKSVTTQAASTASQLDNAITGLLDPDPESIGLIPPGPGFTDMMNSIKAIVDTTSLIAQSGIGTVSAIIYRCNTVIEACQRFNDTVLARINALAFQMRAQAVEIQKTLQVKTGRTVGIFTTTADSTLAAIAPQVSNTMTDLMNLNPKLLATPVIPKLTPVRYYK